MIRIEKDFGAVPLGFTPTPQPVGLFGDIKPSLWQNFADSIAQQKRENLDQLIEYI